ncbi:TrkH family potassium uptake protein [Aquipuribacter hungaricus]|uniref:TrkH family potassium uptake protein n=1 Tax=Aquipuribacter hungaricus TaxID=545624 RepID=A0ABV7WJE2_9MICO
MTGARPDGPTEPAEDPLHHGSLTPDPTVDTPRVRGGIPRWSIRRLLPGGDRTPSALARRAGLEAFLSPARVIPVGLLAVILVGTALLHTPLAVKAVSEGGTGPEGVPPTVVAVFTATSATCVTGLVVVDTPTYWSHFGLVVILLLFQVGGLGIATLGSLVGLAVLRRFGVNSMLAASQDARGFDLGEIRSILPRLMLTTVVIEGVTAALLTARFVLGYGEPPARALWLGVFHAVSAFNNAGFALFSDSLVGFVGDPWITVPVMVAVILGGLGFPVLVELARFRRPGAWSLHTQLVISTSAVLFVGGALVLGALEWGNEDTIGELTLATKLQAAFFMSVAPRSVGFATIDYAGMGEAARIVTGGLMFTGAGSAGTSGGIKVGTLAVLALAVYAEARGDVDVHAFGRRIATATVRQALAVLGFSIVLSGFAIVVMLQLTDLELGDAIFEAVSATAVVGLSTGVTDDLPLPAQWFVVGCMFVGRVGPVAVAAAVATQQRRRLYRLPEARPLIG